MVELESRPQLAGIHKLIEATRYVHGDSIAAYLCYMAVRVIEIWRVLKPTGSLYLHCDHTANGYLRQLLDGIFGNGEGNNPGFKNEIVWQMSGAAGYKALAPKFVRGHDTILYYAKGRKVPFNKSYLPYDDKQLARFSGVDEDGRRYKSITKSRRLYLDESKGVRLTDVWTDIANFHTIVNAPERTGYPTQKPVPLAERIIQASTNPGDIVLDCFAGCAYACIAAERLGRQWIACDFNPRAWTVFKRQFNKPELALLSCNDHQPGQQVMEGAPTATVFGPKELPKRTSPIADDWQTASKLGRVKPTPDYKTKAKDVFDRDQMTERLLKLSGYQAWCCGFANRRQDGSVIEDIANFHLDHIHPKSNGGTDRIYNRAPLCLQHNTSKGNQEITLERLRTEVAMKGQMKVESPDDLIDLNWAYDRAMEIWAIEFAGQRAHAELLV